MTSKFTCVYCGEEITDFLYHEDLPSADLTTLLTECSRCRAIKQEIMTDLKYGKLYEKATASNKNCRSGLKYVLFFIGMLFLDCVLDFNSIFFSAFCCIGATWGVLCFALQSVVNIFKTIRLFNYEKAFIKNKLKEKQKENT